VKLIVTDYSGFGWLKGIRSIWRLTIMTSVLRLAEV